MNKNAPVAGSAQVPPPEIPPGATIIRQTDVDLKEVQKKMDIMTRLSPSKEPVRTMSPAPQMATHSRSSSITAATASAQMTTVAARGRGIMQRISSRTVRIYIFLTIKSINLKFF